MEDLFKNGYVIFPSYISNKTCDKLKSHLEKKFNYDLPYNYYKGHYQLHLPIDKDNIPTEILFDKKINNLLKNVLGESYYMYSYTCNANIAKQNQPYHMDCSHFHTQETIKKFGSPGPPHHIIVNTYLEDTNVNNGSFDIVPESHLTTDFEIDDEGKIDEKYIVNNVRCNYPKGTVIIRDKRTWHRGTKNNTNNVRYMIGMGFSSKWFKSNNLDFSNDSKDLFYDAPFSIWNINFK